MNRRVLAQTHTCHALVPGASALLAVMLGEDLAAIALTADTAWADMDLGIAVELAR